MVCTIVCVHTILRDERTSFNTGLPDAYSSVTPIRLHTENLANRIHMDSPELLHRGREVYRHSDLASDSGGSNSMIGSDCVRAKSTLKDYRTVMALTIILPARRAMT
jgi:hypothetical protein